MGDYEEAAQGLLKGSNMWFFIEEDIGPPSRHGTHSRRNLERKKLTQLLEVLSREPYTTLRESMLLESFHRRKNYTPRLLEVSKRFPQMLPELLRHRTRNWHELSSLPQQTRIRSKSTTNRAIDRNKNLFHTISCLLYQKILPICLCIKLLKYIKNFIH